MKIRNAAAMAIAMMGASAAFAVAAKTGTVSETSAPPPQPQPAASFIPAGLHAPLLVKTTAFKLVPLGPALVKVDFDAYMSSIEHLQKNFTRSADWPHPGISSADAMRDMETEEARFRKRESFAYAVLTPDGRRERGCVYVYPSPVPGYDAVVRLWVTKAEYDAGFDAELYKWVVQWIGKDWPFAKVAYPGRAIPWSSWDAMISAAAKRPARQE